jgi:quercetin dioxygenase-like cupin family protein
MFTMRTALFLTTVLAATSALAGDTKAPVSTAALTQSTPQVWTADTIKWTAVPNAPVSTATLWGDPAKGENGGFLKFNKGAILPLHWHTADHYATVLQGTLTITVDGKDLVLKPGSVGFLPGKTQHATKCGTDVDCVIFSRLSGADDMVPVEAPVAKKK